MISSAYSRIVMFTAVVASSSLARAVPAHNVCVPNALGVPTRFMEPPKWVAWAGAPGVLPADKDVLEDPRWQGAVGQSFGLGGAKAPLELRMLWSHQDHDYLYLSFIMDVEGFTGLPSGATETPRDLFLGFHRSSVFDPGTPGDATDDEHGYIFQFHLTTGDSPTLVEPSYCTRLSDSSAGAGDGCAELQGTNSNPKNYWRLYTDFGQTKPTCGSTTAAHFKPVTDGNTAVPWIVSGQAVRYWKLSMANRWAILLRLQLADSGNPLSAGIDRNSTFWYQATVQTTSNDFANLGWWPRDLTTSLCVDEVGSGALDHAELNNADNYSRLSEVASAGAPGCDGGLLIDSAHIGSLADFTGSTSTLDTTSLSGAVNFKALHADGTKVTNTVVAQVRNTGTDAVKQPLSARFRLAMWGSAPWSFPPPDGKWKDIRATIPTASGQQPGICLGDSDPNAADSCSATTVNINPGAQAAIWFQWTIGNSSIGNSEYCQFGLKPPGAGAGCDDTCSCTAPGALCDPGDTTGTRSTVSSSDPCVSKYFGHQCMLVELSAPAGNVNFAQQSAWNNMNFEQMSVVSREALIDARQLPTRPGQREQNIYLIAMPRNMPNSLPGGATDGALLIRKNALARAEVIAAPYLDDLDKQSDVKIRAAIQKIGRPSGTAVASIRTRAASTGGKDQDPPDFRERIARVARALDIMPESDFKRVRGMLLVAAASNTSASDLNQALVSEIGAIDAADVVPTLEIYPFYQPLGQGHAFQPMTAFTVFLSHEGAMTGMNWVIDGARKIGQNIYQLRIPVGYAKKIQVRAEAIESKDVLPPGNPAWPCAGGCASCGGANRKCGLVAAIGNTAPGLIAGVLVIGRRRRRRKPQPAKTA